MGIETRERPVMKSFKAFLQFLKLFFCRWIIAYWARKDAQRGENRLENRLERLLGKNHPEEDTGMLLTLLDPHQLLREVWEAEDLLLRQPGSVGSLVVSALAHFFLSLYIFWLVDREVLSLFILLSFITFFAMTLSSMLHGVRRAKSEEHHHRPPWRGISWYTFIALFLAHLILVAEEALYGHGHFADILLFSSLLMVNAYLNRSSSEQTVAYGTRRAELEEAREALARYEAKYPIVVASKAYQSARHDIYERLKVAYTLAHKLEKARLAGRT